MARVHSDAPRDTPSQYVAVYTLDTDTLGMIQMNFAHGADESLSVKRRLTAEAFSLLFRSTCIEKSSRVYRARRGLGKYLFRFTLIGCCLPSVCFLGAEDLLTLRNFIKGDDGIIISNIDAAIIAQ